MDLTELPDAVRMLRMCYGAASMSDDTRTHNGAVLLVDDDLVVLGWNHHVTSGKDDGTRESKLRRMIHAEEDAIMSAYRGKMDPRGGTLYCCWAACSVCARLIIQAGVARCIFHDAPHHHDRLDWAADITEANAMLSEAGVEVTRLPVTIGTSVMFGGEMRPV